MKKRRWFLLFLALACNDDKNASSTKTEAEQYAESFKDNLVKSGLSAAAAKKFADAGLSAAKDLKTVETIVPTLIKAAVTDLATDDGSLALDSSTLRLAKLDELIGAIYYTMQNKGFELSKGVQRSLRGTIARSALVALKTSGIAETDYVEAAKILTFTAISHLDDSGIEEKDLPETVGEVSAAMTRGLKEGGFAASSLDEMIHAIMQGAILALKNVSTDPTKYSELAKFAVGKAIGNVDVIDDDLTQTDAFDLVYDTVHGAVYPLRDIGLTRAQNDQILAGIVRGALSEFDNTGVSSATLYADLLSTIVQGAVGGIDEGYGSSLTHTEVEELAGTVAFNAVSGLVDVYIIGNDQLQTAIQGIGLGAIVGLLAAGYSAPTDTASILAMAGPITAKGVEGLDEADVPNVAEEPVNTFLFLREEATISLVTGMVRGLENVQVSDVAIAAASSTIADTVVASLDKGKVSPVGGSAVFKARLELAIHTEAATNLVGDAEGRDEPYIHFFADDDLQ